MIAAIQRVTSAYVRVENETKGQIGNGLLLLLGITHTDTHEDIAWLVQKTVNLRIFGDDEGKMNRSLHDVGGDILLVSQFTLHASTKKGNRPSYTEAAPPEIAVPLYEATIQAFETSLGKPIATGVFGAYMEVSLCNDGPVTILIDTKNRR